MTVGILSHSTRVPTERLVSVHTQPLTLSEHYIPTKLLHKIPISPWPACRPSLTSMTLVPCQRQPACINDAVLPYKVAKVS